AVPLGEAAIRRPGHDVTLIAYAKTVFTCLEAAEVLEKEGVSAEVVDLRTLKPLDGATVLASVRKTGRAVIVHEAAAPRGVGAEIAALLAEHAFDALSAPVARLTGPDVPPPGSFPLEQACVPSAASLVAAVRGQVRASVPRSVSTFAEYPEPRAHSG